MVSTLFKTSAKAQRRFTTVGGNALPIRQGEDPMQPQLNADPITEEIPTKNTQKSASTQANKQQQQAWQRFQQLQNRMLNGMEKTTHVHPPIVYFLLGCVCLGFWALGTSAQVLTSEAWMMREPLQSISFTAFGQLYDAVKGKLGADMLVPFFFGWGVQLALTVSSIGIELPRYPRWRFYLAAGSSIVLIFANSCGDWSSSEKYGFWGQCGFTAVIFFLTFVMMLFAVMAFKKAWSLLKVKKNTQ
jgi:hypothetical protein